MRRQIATEGFKKRARPIEEIQALQTFREAFGGDDDEVTVQNEQVEMIETTKVHTGNLENEKQKVVTATFRGKASSSLVRFVTETASKELIFTPSNYIYNINITAEDNPNDRDFDNKTLVTPAVFYHVKFKDYQSTTENTIKLDIIKNEDKADLENFAVEWVVDSDKEPKVKWIQTDKNKRDEVIAKLAGLNAKVMARAKWEKTKSYRQLINNKPFTDLTFLTDLLDSTVCDFLFLLNTCIPSIDNIVANVDKSIPPLRRVKTINIPDKEEGGGLQDEKWATNPKANALFQDFIIENLDKCDYLSRYGLLLNQWRGIQTISRNELFPLELLTKKELEEEKEISAIRQKYISSLTEFEGVARRWGNFIQESFSAELRKQPDKDKTAEALLKTILPDDYNAIFPGSGPNGVFTRAYQLAVGATKETPNDNVLNRVDKALKLYMEKHLLGPVAEYVQIIKDHEDMIGRNRVLASDNFKLRRQLKKLEDEKKTRSTTGGGDYSSSSNGLLTPLNEPLLRLKVSSGLRNAVPLFKFAELVAGTLVKGTATLFKINFEDAIFEIVKRKVNLSESIESVALGNAINEFKAQLNQDALRPIFLKCLLSAKETVGNMFRVVHLNPPTEEKLYEIVEFAALVGVYIVQEEETSKTISTTKTDKTQLDQTIFRCNLELRAAFQRKGFRINNTPADDARQMRRVF